MEKVIVIDFDGTICDFKYPKMGEPKKGVREALFKLKELGYTIQILSCRTSPDLKKHPIERLEQVRDMERYLKENNIPYDEVLNKDKPLAVWYIDDRAIGFRDNWDEVIGEISKDE